MTDVEDTDEDFYVFEPESRKAILQSIGLPEGELADRLILYCEFAADAALSDWDFYSKMPNLKSAKKRLDDIWWHIHCAIELASFNGNNEQSDIFWRIVLRGKKLEEFQSDWNRFARAYNMMIVSRRYLERVNLDRLMFSNKKYCTDILNECVTGSGFLKTLSVIYYHVLGKKCGRSKSTIGPFVRFAHAVMSELPALTPSIETINERWARMEFEPEGKAWIEEYVRAYCARRGIPPPSDDSENPPGK
jgi:hypothetical protein